MEEFDVERRMVLVQHAADEGQRAAQEEQDRDHDDSLLCSEFELKLVE